LETFAAANVGKRNTFSAGFFWGKYDHFPIPEKSFPVFENDKLMTELFLSSNCKK